MSDHFADAVERHCDVAIVGGSAAGLAAALQISRQRRSVIVIDAGEPRNAPADHMHGYLGREGISPAKMAEITQEEVRSYGVEILGGDVVDISRTDDNSFRATLTGGHTVIARRVLAATGVVDELPDIDGLVEHWGQDVIHCPFCHGYEVRDLRIVQIITHPMGLHQAQLFCQLSADLTLVLHDGVAADHPEVDMLRAAGVSVIDERAQRIVSDERGRVESVEMVGGVRIAADAVVVGTRFRARADAFASLGLTTVDHPAGLGAYLETDESGATSVPGLYAAGNVADPRQQVLQAAAQGSWVGAMISSDLAREDIEFAGRSSGNQADWDHRYNKEQMWSGNPNPTLVSELEGVAPGRALDVGAGEGGDAVWLAEQGWQVTATDISSRALNRITAAAHERTLKLECLKADANAYRPFEIGVFDLVSAHYASIPRTPDNRGINNILDAVAPGGTLLIVSHDVRAMRTQMEQNHHSQPFDPDAYVQVDDFLAPLAAALEWEITLHDKRPRTHGAASAAHHVDDIVLRARRRLGDQIASLSSSSLKPTGV
ncbi:MAG: FAD-dependent oxidoreductase [Actinomycetota bacterium]